MGKEDKSAILIENQTCSSLLLMVEALLENFEGLCFKEPFTEVAFV